VFALQELIANILFDRPGSEARQSSESAVYSPRYGCSFRANFGGVRIPRVDNRLGGVVECNAKRTSHLVLLEASMACLAQ
jgi:hypothetical protein